MKKLKQERGAIAVFTAATLVVLIGSAALAVDTGHAALQKRHVQGIADRVALDAVRAVGDRYDPTLNTQARAEQFALEAATRNGYDPTAGIHSLTVQLGKLDRNTNTFVTPAPGGPDFADAVRVILHDGVEHGFAPGSTEFDVEAIAGIEAQAGIRAGSGLAGFSSSGIYDPILEELIGVSLDVGNYDALIGAEVDWGDIWLNLGLGSADQVLQGGVTMDELFQATIDALNAKGDPASIEAATVLGDHKEEIDTSEEFTFEEMLEVGTGKPNEAAGASVNVLDLITGGATVANGDNLIEIDLPLTIPGVSSGTMKMGIIEPAKLAIGPARQNVAGEWITRASTAQARIQFDLQLAAPLIVGLTAVPVTLPIYLDSAGADVDVTGIDCLLPLDSSPVMTHVETHAVEAHVGQVNSAALTGGTVNVEPADLVVNPALLTITAEASVVVSEGEDDLTFTGPFDQPPPPESRPTQMSGSGDVSMDSLSGNVTVNVSAVPPLIVNPVAIADQVNTLIAPVLSLVDTTLIDALLETPLGLYFGSADVTNQSLNCHYRRLAG